MCWLPSDVLYHKLYNTHYGWIVTTLTIVCVSCRLVRSIIHFLINTVAALAAKP